MRKLLFSTVALAALMTAPIAMADPNDNPKQHDSAKPDRGDNDRGNNADRGNGPGGGATSGPAMLGGPNGGNADHDRNNDNSKTVIHNDNDKTVIRDNDRVVNKTVVHKTVDRSLVLKVRANIRAPHRYRAPRAYVQPAGWYPHRWVYGERLPRAFFAPDYFILDFTAFGLMAPWDGYEWVRYGNDALLIDVETGEVIRVEYDVFY
jgi:Ni/Co efflux regulator RcnB